MNPRDALYHGKILKQSRDHNHAHLGGDNYVIRFTARSQAAYDHFCRATLAGVGGAARPGIAHERMRHLTCDREYSWRGRRVERRRDESV